MALRSVCPFGWLNIVRCIDLNNPTPATLQDFSGIDVSGSVSHWPFAKAIPFDDHIVKEQYRWWKKKKKETSRSNVTTNQIHTCYPFLTRFKPRSITKHQNHEKSCQELDLGDSKEQSQEKIRAFDCSRARTRAISGRSNALRSTTCRTVANC